MQNNFVYLFHWPWIKPRWCLQYLWSRAAYACCLGNRVTPTRGTFFLTFYSELPQETTVELELVLPLVSFGWRFYVRLLAKATELVAASLFFFPLLLAMGCLLHNWLFRVELTAVEPNLLYIYILFLAACSGALCAVRENNTAHGYTLTDSQFLNSKSKLLFNKSSYLRFPRSKSHINSSFIFVAVDIFKSWHT